MPTNFPVSLDSLTNPIGTDRMSSPSHAAQHTNANDAIEALQAKVGVDGSGNATSLDYKIAHLGDWQTWTPVLEFGGTAVTAGNSTVIGRYTQIGNTVHAMISYTWGSTLNKNGGSNQMQFTLPVNRNTQWDAIAVGNARFYDVSATQYYMRTAFLHTGQRLRFAHPDGTTVTDDVPTTWNNGDIISVSFTYEAA